MDQTWITDRRPTEADGDADGEVFARRCPTSSDSSLLYWGYVGAGVPWHHTGCWEPPAPRPVAPTTTPRKFVALTRTVHEFGHTIDAIDEDGVAWWRVSGPGEYQSVSWTQLESLPAREVQADA